MTMVFEVKGETVEIKFTYRLNFKANKKLGSKDKDGKPQPDGAGTLFSQVLDKDDMAIVNLIQLVSDKSTEEAALSAIELKIDQYISDGLDEEEAYDKLFADVKEEMLSSGFFVSKVKQHMKNMEKVVKYLNGKKTEEEKQQAKMLQELLENMKNEISSSTVPEKD